METESPEPRLRRTLGVLDATTIGLGAIIGAGVFVAISPAVETAGAGALIAMLVAAFVALFNSLSSAQLAAAYPESGGTYVYGRRVLNNLVGFIAGWVFIIAAVSADSAIALTFASYLAHLLPGAPPRGVAIGVALLVVMLNYFGVGYSARANSVLVALKVAVLLIFIVLGAFFFNVRRLAPFPGGDTLDILHAAAILFFAYTGYARIATLGEEVKDPERNIPRAILAALGGSTFLYMATLLVALGLVGAGGIAGSDAPLNTAVEVTGVALGVFAVSAGALIATFTVLLTDILGISRMIFAMARNRDLPHRLSTVHATQRTPHLAVLLTGAVVILLTAFLPLRSLVEAGSFGLLIYYGITNLAAFLLSDEKRRYHRGWAAAGLISCFTLAFFLPWQVIALELLVVAAGLLYFRLKHVGGISPQ